MDLHEKGYLLQEYLDAAGDFDYEAYRGAQVAANKRDIRAVWVREPNIEFLSEYIRGRPGKPEVGLCHGTRRGHEQKWFKKYLGCDVIGTEISDTASQFPDTIQWDFHNVKREWVGNIDFIYSNSLDHSYDPRRALTAWMRCLRPGGLCIIEYAAGNDEMSNERDPFGVRLEMLPYLILRWGAGRFYVAEILDAPVDVKKGWGVWFLVLEGRI